MRQENLERTGGGISSTHTSTSKTRDVFGKIISWVLSHENEAKLFVSKILSGEYQMVGNGQDLRKKHTGLGLYTYTLFIKVEGNIQEIDIVFYKDTNKKVFLHAGDISAEVTGEDCLNIIQKLSEIYTPPVYTADGKWGVRCLAFN